MGQMVIQATASQTKPSASSRSTGFEKGVVYVQVSGAGTGTWAGTFNLAPVSSAGVVGNAKTYAVSNSAPMVDADIQTGAPAFIGWFTSVSGTVTLSGSVDG